MIRKNLALILGILLLVSFVIAETTTPPATGTQQQGVTQTVNSETGVTTLSQNGEEFMSIPRGFEVSEASPSVYTWEGNEGTLTGKVYTLKNTGQGTKQGDSTTVKFGNSEVDVPLFSQATLYQDKDGNSYIYNSGAGNPISLKTPSGGTFEKVEGARFKLDENGEVLKADFFPPKEMGVEQGGMGYTFQDLNGNKIHFSGNNIGENAQILFDAEKGEVFAHLGHNPSEHGYFHFYDGGSGATKSDIELYTGLKNQKFPPDFSAKLDDNGQIVSAQIRGGYYSHQDSTGTRRTFMMPGEGIDKDGFFVSRQDVFNNEGNGVYIYDSKGIAESGYVYGKVSMSVDSRMASGNQQDFMNNLAGYSYQGTSENSWLSFNTDNQGQTVLTTGQDFVIRGLLSPEPILTNQGGNLKWSTSGAKTEVPLDIYYNSEMDRPKTGVVRTMYGGGTPYYVRTSTNPSEPTFQTENVQIASTSSTTAQNQQQQVAQNSIWQRLFGK